MNSQEQELSEKFLLPFFKPYFKDYEHQFKIIKSTHERDRANISQSLIFQILEVFDKDINRCIKNIEEIFKVGLKSNYFSNIQVSEIESAIMNRIIPEFLGKKSHDYAFEQVTLCLHFLFHFLHKINKVPANFYHECILFLSILNLLDEISTKVENNNKKKNNREKIFV